MKRLLIFCLAATLAWVDVEPTRAQISRAHASSPAVSEYKLKAVYVVKFLQYVLLPENVSTQSKICILGTLEPEKKAEFLSIISKATPKPDVSSISNVEEAKGCTVLFIATSEDASVTQLLAALGGKPVLTISDIQGFAQQGGMVELPLVGENVRFIVNKRSITQAGLSVNPELLRVAYSVIE